ncbi:MAG: amidohydrolase family protein [Chloroflexi bacterium]|nr:amidohydrolase family protein [Chloroflexota bacterium]
MESGAGWAPFWLNRMDEHYEKLHRFYPEITEEPSATFKRQCFLGVEPDDHLMPQMVDSGLEDTLIFSSDFPHFDAIFPGSAAALADRNDLSPEAKRKALRDNGLRMYGVKK